MDWNNSLSCFPILDSAFIGLNQEHGGLAGVKCVARAEQFQPDAPVLKLRYLTCLVSLANGLSQHSLGYHPRK